MLDYNQPRLNYLEFRWVTGLQSLWPHDCLVSPSRARVRGSRSYPVYRVFPVFFAPVNRVPHGYGGRAQQSEPEGEDSGMVQHGDMMP